MRASCRGNGNYQNRRLEVHVWEKRRTGCSLHVSPLCGLSAIKGRCNSSLPACSGCCSCAISPDGPGRQTSGGGAHCITAVSPDRKHPQGRFRRPPCTRRDGGSGRRDTQAPVTRASRWPRRRSDRRRGTQAASPACVRCGAQSRRASELCASADSAKSSSRCAVCRGGAVFILSWRNPDAGGRVWTAGWSRRHRVRGFAAALNVGESPCGATLCEHHITAGNIYSTNSLPCRYGNSTCGRRY